MKRVIRLLRGAAFAVGIHGLLLLAFGGAQKLVPDAFDAAAGEVALWLLAVPALLLTAPVMPLLWRLGLVDATGWFAWPKPLGLALAYAAWIAALWVLARLLQIRQDTPDGGARRMDKHPDSGSRPG